MMNRPTLIALAACAAMLGTAARAQTLQHELSHHAAQQSHIAADESRGQLVPATAGALHEQAAVVERVEAAALADPDAASLRQLNYAERDLDRAIAHAERPQPTAHRADAPLDRMHSQVAGAREAEQQRWLAAEYRHGQLDREQAAQLERDQADVVTQQATLEQRGHESVDEALGVQHLQDVQDWAIRDARAGRA